MIVRKREVARRLFAYELNRSTRKIESAEDKAPVYVLTPTGMRCNRIFVVGVLLEKEEVRPDSNIWRIRVSDPTGVFIGYVSRFQPDALDTLLEIEPPEMIAIVGKVRVFEGETRNFVSIRPEYVAVVDSDVRDYWVYETAKRTLERIERMESNRDDEDVALAWQIYNPNLEEYRDVVRQALVTIKEEFEIFEGKEAKEEKEEPRIEKGKKEEETLEKEKEIRKAKEEEIEDIEDLEEFEDEFEFEEEEWDLSDILGD